MAARSSTCSTATKVDIVLLDIRMPEMDGLEAARHIAGMAAPPGHHLHDRVRHLRDQGLRGERDRLPAQAHPPRAPAHRARQDPRGAAGLAARRSRPPPTSRARHLSVHERGKIHLVPLADVLYLRAELKYVTVRTAEREYLVEESLTHLEEEFESAFVRVHRNCLVARARHRRVRAQRRGERIGLGGGDQGHRREAAREPAPAPRGEGVPLALTPSTGGSPKVLRRNSMKNFTFAGSRRRSG